MDFVIDLLLSHFMIVAVRPLIFQIRVHLFNVLVSSAEVNHNCEKGSWDSDGSSQEWQNVVQRYKVSILLHGLIVKHESQFEKHILLV